MPLDAKRAAAAEVEIEQLRGLDLAALQARWHSLRGRLAPRHLPRHLLLRLLAYQLQASAHGDLDPAIRRYLDQIAQAAASGAEDPVRQPISRRPAVGTILVREWAGGVCHVTALADGYAWNGTTYRSLSQVARAITGTRWNGRRFFGLPTTPTGHEVPP
jgi:Protein of unknown function (DUF2924)